MIKTTVDSQWNGDKIKVQAKKWSGGTAFELGLIVEGQAKLLAPIDFGRLAASITTQAIDKGTKPTGHGAVATDIIQKPGDTNQVLVGTPVLYGNYIEFGTFKMNAQPFLRPALDLAKGKALTIMQKNGKFFFMEYLD